jgi:RimJ/RimL family protein N-acetyltransferase
MSEPAWLVRSATADDAALLASFRSATSTARWDVEVEEEITSGRLLAWWSDPAAANWDPRLLLLFDRESAELVGVAAHERESLLDADGTEIAGTHLHVAALSTTWQGRSFATGEKASDVLMSAVMQDVKDRVPPRWARVYATVHEDNVRSLRLCARFGLTADMPRSHPSYRRVITERQDS